MKYVDSVTGWQTDELVADTSIPIRIENISVSSTATIERGDLLCAASLSGVFAPVSSSADANKILMLAANDFVADSLNTVMQAYSAGCFSREKIKMNGDSSITIQDFEPELRRQNIYLRRLQEN